MKKSLVILLALIMIISAMLVGCSGENTPETLKFGAGVYISAPSATDATEDKDGSGKVDVTVAAVTVDANGKIVACALDTASNTVTFTVDGKAVAVESFKTKLELGDDYGMKSPYGSTKEWYEHLEAFKNVVKGKTLAEVKAMVVEGNKGNDEVVAAGCTIMIHEFVGAIEKAYNAATASNVTANDTLKVTAATEQTCSDATEDKDGSNKVATTVFASAVDANGKIIAASSDCVEVAFTFTTAGASTFDATKAVLSKKEQGDNYGMKSPYGSAKEWYEHASAFDAACIGKTPAEVAGLMAADGKGVDTLKAAGCTIYVTGFVKAASK